MDLKIYINFNYNNYQPWKITLFGGTFVAPNHNGIRPFNESETVSICRGNSLATTLRTINTIVDDLVRVKRIIDRAFSAEEIRDLYKKACETPSRNHPNGGGWVLNMAHRVSKFKGLCCLSIREILINARLNDDAALTYFVFELTNAVGAAKIDRLQKKVASGSIDREMYVKSMEAIEFEGTLLHHRIMKAATERLGWNKEMDNYRSHEDVSFEEYWNAVKETYHADFHRQKYQQIRSEHQNKTTSFFKSVRDFIGSIYSSRS